MRGLTMRLATQWRDGPGAGDGGGEDGGGWPDGRAVGGRGEGAGTELGTGAAGRRALAAIRTGPG